MTLHSPRIKDLSPAELKNYISRGILRVTMETKLPMCIEDTPEYLLFKKLKGKKIGVAEAGRKYKIPNPSISRWTRKGFIKIIERVGQKVLLDESYVAYCVYIYLRYPGQGRWAFNANGTPRPPGVNLRNTIKIKKT